MEIIDALLIIIFAVGVYYGYIKGILKNITDFLALFVAMLLASVLKTPISNMLYKFLPFFNYKEGLYSLNLIIYQLIIYALLILLFLGIYQMIIMKTKLKDVIVETEIETPFVSKILGALVGGPLLILFTYNILLVLVSPIFNIEEINDSKFVKGLLDKTPIISKYNKSLYDSEKYVNEIINNKNLFSMDKSYLDNKIINEMINNGFITDEKVEVLYDKGLLYKYESSEENNDDMNFEEELENNNEEEIYEDYPSYEGDESLEMKPIN